jgi:transcriptional regulator with XRE-family HTH domain
LCVIGRSDYANIGIENLFLALNIVVEAVMIMPSIGEKIREARLQRGLTQGDLAEDLVTPSMISQIEADKAKPSYPLLTAIANRLGLPVEHFLNELQDQFTLTTYLRLAEYYLLLKQPEMAESTLRSVDPPLPPGLDYQEYHLYLARACRMLNRSYEAIMLLEDLREQALRHQDRKLLFSVCKESGYVEFAIDNADGAMHEWKKALHIGETLWAEGEWGSVEAQAELSEVCTCLHQLYTQMRDTSNALKMATRAAELTKGFGRVRDIADALVSDGVRALEAGDSARAKLALERAISVIHTTQWIEQALVAWAMQPTADKETDPWEQAAMATTTMDPAIHLQAELHHIARHLEQGDAVGALEQVRRCKDFMASCESEIPGFSSWQNGLRHRLEVKAARAHFALGQVSEGMRIFQDTKEALMQEGLHKFAAYVVAQWVQCEMESGQMSKGLELTQELQKLLVQANNRT